MSIDTDQMEDSNAHNEETIDFYFSKNTRNRAARTSSTEDSGTSSEINELGRQSNSTRTCSNCGTSSTSTWRNLGELLVCNACKCFYRKHGRNRPVHMRKDTIVTRHRKSCKPGVPNEGMFQINEDSNDIINISELDSSAIAEAVFMMLQYLKNL